MFSFLIFEVIHNRSHVLLHLFTYWLFRPDVKEQRMQHFSALQALADRALLLQFFLDVLLFSPSALVSAAASATAYVSLSA